MFSALLGVDSPAVSAVRREVAGRIALTTSRAISRTESLEMVLETGIDADHGVISLLQREVRVRGESLKNVVVIRKTEENREESELGKSVRPRLSRRNNTADFCTQALLAGVIGEVCLVGFTRREEFHPRLMAKRDVTTLTRNAYLRPQLIDGLLVGAMLEDNFTVHLRSCRYMIPKASRSEASHLAASAAVVGRTRTGSTSTCPLVVRAPFDCTNMTGRAHEQRDDRDFVNSGHSGIEEQRKGYTGGQWYKESITVLLYS